MAKVNEVVKNFVNEVIEVSARDGVMPWHRPWSNGGMLNSPSWNRRSAKADGTISQRYSSFNCMLLSIGYDAEKKRNVFDGLSGEWATFKDITDEGGKIIKGSKGRHVVFFSFIDDKDKDGKPVFTEDGKKKVHPMLRYYTVFHVETMTTLEPKGNGEFAKRSPIEDLEEIINGYVSRDGRLAFKPRVSDKAYYSPAQDMVVVPVIEQYKDVAEYYSTTFHELVHSTGHKSRLDRGFENSVAFGSADYSREELVAEIGSASIMALTEYGNNRTRNNSIAYVQGWLKALKDDPNMLMWASNRADKAVELILGVQ